MEASGKRVAGSGSPLSRADRLALRRAKRAELIDHFGWAAPAVVATLTDAQIDDYCFHARDKETGAIRRPKPAVVQTIGEEAHVARYLAQAAMMGVRREAQVAMVAKIRGHWARKRGGNGDGSGGADRVTGATS